MKINSINCVTILRILWKNETQYDVFLHKYEMIFSYPEEIDVNTCADEYLEEIIGRYV